MTPEERYADAWLAELWATVPEYQPHKERPRVVKRAGDKRRKKAA